ncbi:MAG: nucleoside triphosphate pyrophosphohydrolase [Clostridia bacterium]
MKINIVGIGTDVDEMTVKAYKLIKSGLPLFARSNRLKGLQSLVDENFAIESFDDIFDATEDFDELNNAIATRLIEKATEFGEIVYLVDGSGGFEKALPNVKNVELKYFPTLSKGSAAHACVGGGESLTEISAYDFVEINNFGGIVAKYIYVFDIDTAEIASAVKLNFSKIIDDEQEIVFSQNQNIKKMPLYQLDWEKTFDENTGILVEVKGTLEKNVFNFTDLLNIMDRLRADDGCPWDRAQTHASIRMSAIEEAYEVAEAIDLNRADKLQEEIGDLMLQTVLHTKIASDSGEFEITDVISELCHKLIDRHTHVFGKDKAKNESEALSTWDNNKEILKGQATPMQAINDIPKTLPSIMYAEKVAKKAAKTNFDFQCVSQIFDKVNEELDELKQAVDENSNIEEELGDTFFALANLSRFLKLNGELALTKSSQKFIARFDKMMNIIEKEKLDYKSLSDDEWNRIYLDAKAELNKV